VGAHQALRAVGPQEALLVLEAAAFGERARNHGAAHLPVVLVHALEVRLEARLEAPRLEAEDAVELVGPREAAALRVPFPAAQAGERLRLREKRAPLEQRLLGALPLGDVGRHAADAGDATRGIEHG